MPSKASAHCLEFLLCIHSLTMDAHIHTHIHTPTHTHMHRYTTTSTATLSLCIVVMLLVSVKSKTVFQTDTLYSCLLSLVSLSLCVISLVSSHTPTAGYIYMLHSNREQPSRQPTLHGARATQSHSFHPLTTHSSTFMPQAHALYLLPHTLQKNYPPPHIYIYTHPHTHTLSLSFSHSHTHTHTH